MFLFQSGFSQHFGLAARKAFGGLHVNRLGVLFGDHGVGYELFHFLTVGTLDSGVVHRPDDFLGNVVFVVSVGEELVDVFSPLSESVDILAKGIEVILGDNNGVLHKHVVHLGLAGRSGGSAFVEEHALL